MGKLFDNPIIDRPHLTGSGIQKIYRFDNGYGASVVRFEMAFGGYGSYTDNENEFELGVIFFPDKSTEDYHLTYDTPITDDVIGHLTEAEVEKILKKIKTLKKQ